MQKILGNLILLKNPNLKNRNSLEKLVTTELPSIYLTHFEKQSHINEQISWFPWSNTNCKYTPALKKSLRTSVHTIFKNG